MTSAISVIIPTYNAQAFIAETLRSIHLQTQLPDEIIVVDDHSTDNTCSVVERFVANSPVPMCLIRLPENTGGPATPLNIGLESARHPLIALMDHDDLMLPDKLRNQRQVLERSPEVGLVFSDYQTFDDGGIQPGLSRHARESLQAAGIPRDNFYVIPSRAITAIQLLDCGIIQSCSNLLFRRELWHDGNRFDPHYNLISDYVFKLKAGLQAAVGYLPECLFHKRIHPQNSFGRESETILRRQIEEVVLQTLREVPELLNDHGLRARLGEMFLGRGWSMRRAGRFADSFRYYREALSIVGPNYPVLSHLGKLALAYLGCFVRRPSPETL